MITSCYKTNQLQYIEHGLLSIMTIIGSTEKLKENLACRLSY